MRIFAKDIKRSDILIKKFMGFSGLGVLCLSLKFYWILKCILMFYWPSNLYDNWSWQNKFFFHLLKDLNIFIYK